MTGPHTKVMGQLESVGSQVLDEGPSWNSL